MKPVLFQIGGLEVMSFSVMAFLAMLAGMIVAVLEAKRFGWPIPRTVRLVIACTVLGFLGAHVCYALTQYFLPWDQWFAVFIDFRYGNVWFGGFITSWMYCAWYARKHRIPFLQMSDFAALIVMVSQATGRLGCILNGCCYGRPTDLPWGMMLSTPEYGLTAVHPVPLYEAAYLMVVFAVLWKLRKRLPTGMILGCYLFLAALGRIFLEIYRGDNIRGFVAGSVSTSQAIGAVVMLSSIPVFLAAKRKMKS